MKLLSFEYSSSFNKWKLHKVFFDDMNLLVGISGAGKTQTLKAIMAVREIALGKAEENKIIGSKWTITFSIDNNIYVWSGEYDSKLITSFNIKGKNNFKRTNIKESNPILIKEKLVKNGDAVLFDRNSNTIKFNNENIPKVSPNKSLIEVFSGEEEIQKIVDEFNRIYFIDYNFETRLRILAKLDSHETPNEIEDIRRENYPVLLKIVLAYKFFRTVFDQIKFSFMDVFPNVIDVRVTETTDDDSDEIWELQIKEENTEWISEDLLSNGMMKSLLHIALLNLYPKDSVVLIDEVENGLGVNCIHVITETHSLKNKIQFILTSHHPYIINNIDISNWKIVTRKGSEVVIKNSNEFYLGQSKHEAFKQLLNLGSYLDGVQ